MKITTYIDERLLAQAMRASHARTKREALENGLRNLLAGIRRKTFVKEFDHLRLCLTPSDLERIRQ
jgi:Arc/MetJ family transcription regulator